MKELHIGDQNKIHKEGQRNSMCSNLEPSRCPSLCLVNTNKLSTEDAINELAKLLAYISITQKNNEHNRRKNSK